LGIYEDSQKTFADPLTEVLPNWAPALLARAVEAELQPCSAAMPAS
jgi:hypothetical protein